MVGPRIKKKDTRMREAIGPAERLTLTLRYLASGNDQQSLSFSYRIGKATVSNIIHEALTAIWSLLTEDRYLRPPENQADWLRISNEFETVWNLPHCVGAIDGKHIAMQCPRKSGSMYYNYKGFFSIVLMAVCHGNYISLWLILDSMVATMTVVFLAIQKWGKHLKMAPSISQLQYIC